MFTQFLLNIVIGSKNGVFFLFCSVYSSFFESETSLNYSYELDFVKSRLLTVMT